MKIKIFSDTCPSELEGHVNEWLKLNPSIEVAQMTSQFNSEVNTSDGGALVWSGWSYITVLYREKK